MPDYKETTVAGASFSRCRLIEIRNPYQQTPATTFTEERITTLADRILRDQPDAPIVVQYNPIEQIKLYDPVTLEPTGSTVTMQDFYLMLFSAYLHFAKQRDAIAFSKSPAPAMAEATAAGDASVTAQA